MEDQHRVRKRWWPYWFALAGVVGALCAHNLVSYRVAAPGRVSDARGFFSSGVSRPATGRIDIVTVSIRHANPVEVLRARLDGAVRLIPRGDTGADLVAASGGRLDRATRDALQAALTYVEVFGARAEDEIDVAELPDDVMGASGGLMLALAAVERLTDEDVTGGRHVTGTGTITPTGRVGPVVGVPYKVAGAERVGADVFLVHPSLVETARAASRRIEVVGVRTLAEAIDVLRRA